MGTTKVGQPTHTSSKPDVSFPSWLIERAVGPHAGASGLHQVPQRAATPVRGRYTVVVAAANRIGTVYCHRTGVKRNGTELREYTLN